MKNDQDENRNKEISQTQNKNNQSVKNKNGKNTESKKTNKKKNRIQLKPLQELNSHMSVRYLRQQKGQIANKKSQSDKRKTRNRNIEIEGLIYQKKRLQAENANRKSYIAELKDKLHVGSIKKAIQVIDKGQAEYNNFKNDIKHNYISRTDNPINSRSDITNNDCFIVGKRFIQNELLRHHNDFDVKSLEKELNNQLDKVRSATQNPPVIPNNNHEQDSDNNENNFDNNN